MHTNTSHTSQAVISILTLNVEGGAQCNMASVEGSGFGYTAVTLLLHRCFAVVTLLLHC
jgi:hypothetical protein